MIQVNVWLEDTGLSKNPTALIQYIVCRKLLETADPFLQILEQ